MDSPNSTTKRNSGSQETTVPVDVKPSRPSARVDWNTSTSTPQAAPTDSRVSTAAMSATAIERNATVSTTTVSRSTNPNTSGSREAMVAPKSALNAVSPATPVRTPGSAPTVVGRAARNRSTDAVAAPLPGTSGS